MSPSYYFVCFMLAMAVTGGAGNDKIKLPKDENIYNVIRKFHRIPDHGTYKRQNNKNCPPPPGQGILQVKSDTLDISLTNNNRSVLENLRFMCGQAQIRKKVPIGWEMQTQNGGLPKNVTLYTTSLQFVPLCCPGYIRDHNDICVPKCKGGCKDGVCVSPGNCACYQGYGENTQGECVLTCPCKCPHGRCRGDTCVCGAGYALNPLSQTCDPVCPDRCVNAECTTPGVCTCLPGFKRKDTDEDYFCSPDCGGECKHGQCIAPNVCQCKEGYQKSKSGACVPRCAGCEHGDCVQPFKCRCHSGYTRVGDDCEPLCEFQCYNATCTAPNTCGCFSGFVKVSPLSCVPECKPACANAECVAPNQCQCHKYFYKKSSSYLQHICFHTSLQLISAAHQLAGDLSNRSN